MNADGSWTPTWSTSGGVRIEVRHSFEGNGHKSNHGTGIILKGGKVLTANHVLTENVTGETLQVVLTLADGRILFASIEKQGEKDWARLQLAGFPPSGGMSGGPVLNLQGQLIGVQHSVSKTTEDATGKILYCKIDAVPVAAINQP